MTAAAVGKASKPKASRASLDSLVAAGKIFSWGPGKYWHRDAGEVARERLLEITQRELLTAAALKKIVGVPAAVSGSVLKALLAEKALREVAGKKILNEAHPDAGLYRDQGMVARERLLAMSREAVIDGKEVAGEIDAKVVEKARKALVKEGLLREVAGKRYVNAAHPEKYLEAEIGRLLSEFGMGRPVERIRELLGARVSVEEVAERLFAAMNRIAFAPGTTVTFYRLRQQTELDGVSKELFDQAALLLQKQRRALLSEHGQGSRLPKEEQDVLVTDGHGNYYVSLYSI